MSAERKSFLLHFDSLGILDKLTKEQAGDLFIACRDYNLGEELKLDPILELVFFSFKSQFDRDIKKYKNIVDRNKNNGSKGGRPKKQDEAKKPSGLTGNPEEPKKADSVNVSDSVNKNVNDSKSDSNKDLVQATPKPSKYNYSDIDYQCSEWIYSLVVKVAPSSKKPNFESWANTIRLMRESDGLTHQDISNVFTWANADSFWSTNILSVAKLRKQFPQLQAKMKGANNGHQTTGKKLSAYERARAANAEYRQPEPNECEMGMGANGGYLGRTVDEGERGAALIDMDNEPFIDYEQPS